MLYLPFKIEAVAEGKQEKLETCAQLPEPLKKQCQENMHLSLYLENLARNKMVIPDYHDKVSRGLRAIKNRNLIYPVGDSLFVHILGNPEDIRDYYIPIEPSFGQSLERLLEQIEDHIAEYIEDLEGITDSAKRTEAIYHIVDRVVTVRGKSSVPAMAVPKKNEKSSVLNGLMNDHKVKDKIVLTPFQYQSVKYLLKRKLEGMGVLEPLIKDNNIEDISCSGLGSVFVEHKVFGGVRTSIGFEDHLELDKFVIQLAERIKHPVTFRNPVVDATLPDGSRINIVYGTDVSKRGSNFTIRKFSPTPLSILELVEGGSMTYEMAAYLSLVIQEQMNCWVSGETASGKTTILNALTVFIPPTSKIVTLEDTPEVQVPQPNWIRGVTREQTKNSDSSSVTLFDLLKAALRQRPNFIIVGEIRGVEGAVAFQAMQTGHACMATFHASSVTKLIQRLTGNPINVPKTYVDNLNVVLTTAAVRLPDGKSGRRVTSINEIISYDSVSDSFSFIEVFVWNPVDDTFIFRGFMNSYLLEYKIAPRRGLPPDRRREIYQVIKQRAKILQRIKDEKITNFYDLYATLTKAYKEGHFR